MIQGLEPVLPGRQRFRLGGREKCVPKGIVGRSYPHCPHNRPGDHQRGQQQPDIQSIELPPQSQPVLKTQYHEMETKGLGREDSVCAQRKGSGPRD